MIPDWMIDKLKKNERREEQRPQLEIPLPPPPDKEEERRNPSVEL